MTQQYTPVTWQDETTSQQGTLINAERLNQMQTAHHYADGWEEVDAVPTADPGTAYHKVVYCTADSTFYRWDGTEWTADIDDETKALLQQEIARATEAEGELAQDIADEETRATAAETALGDRVTAETSARTSADTALGQRIDTEATARESADLELGADIGAETARARQAEQTNAQAIATHVADKQNPHEVTKAQLGLGNVDNTADLDKPISTATQSALDAKADRATTYTKTETDTLLATKADQATTYTKTETDTLLGAKADSTALATKLDTLSTTGLHAYTHNGATQSEVSVIDGTTASTIPIRDANGRLQAADPASGATDKTLVTANWVSQSGSGAPNNLMHTNGNEHASGDKIYDDIIEGINRPKSIVLSAPSGQDYFKVVSWNQVNNLIVNIKLIGSNYGTSLISIIEGYLWSNGGAFHFHKFGGGAISADQFKTTVKDGVVTLFFRAAVGLRYSAYVIGTWNYYNAAGRINNSSFTYGDGTTYAEPTTSEYASVTDGVMES